MPLDALSAKARMIVPVGAIASRCVADAVLADRGLDVGGQARGKAWRRQVQVRVEQRKGAALLRELHRGPVGRVAHARRDLAAMLPPARPRRNAGRASQARHRGRCSPARRGAWPSLPPLLRQGPGRDVEHVVEHAHRDRDHAREALEVEACRAVNGRARSSRQVDGTEVAAAVGRQRLLAAGVRRLDRLAIREVVVAVDAVEEQHARLGMVVGAERMICVPQLACRGTLR